jgi:8-oxo-dGTP diphosphatase
MEIDINKTVRGAVGVMVMKDGRVLLGKRVSTQDWSFPGGKMEYHETFEDCAKRETLEECGLTLNKLKVICVNNEIFDKGHFINVGLFCDDFSGELETREPDKLFDWTWYDLDNLPTPIFSPSRNMIENYKKGEFYLETNQ